MELSPQLKSIIQSAVCKAHHVHPIITLTKDDKMKIECCCANFEVECFHICKKIMEGQPVMYIAS